MKVRVVVWPVPQSTELDMIFLNGEWYFVPKGKYHTGDEVSVEEIKNEKVQ